MAQPYSSQFFEDQRRGSVQSAAKIVPLIMQALHPRAVVDVGCGVGTWLAVFAEHGVADTLGLDGGYVDPALLQIPRERFLAHDLTTPIALTRRFDLVLCLEVAEHLPAEHAPTLIDSLVGLGPAVVFSAAIPFQGGTHHVNEQWPDFWARHFAARGYVPVDYFRRKIWQVPGIEWWYAQNLLLYIERDHLAANALLRREAEDTPATPLSLVHPAKYLEVVFLSRLAQKAIDIVSPGESFILVDDGQIGVQHIPGRRGWPFLERDGIYWGKPADDAEAIRELERLRRSGAAFMIFAWLSFWWLDHYVGLNRYLRATFHCVADNDCLIAFDLRHENP
jgi:SAM-dependent methyltransferase